MKKSILFVAIALLFTTVLPSCSGDDVPANTIPSQFTRKVVVEKFTGEWCGVCGATASWFQGMEKSSNQFIYVGIHAGSASDRYKDNPACQSMYQALIQKLRHPNMTSIGFPNAMFNREPGGFPAQVINGYQGQSAWQGKYDEEKAEVAKAGLSIRSELNGSTLTTFVSYHLKEALDGEHRITAYLVESGLDGSQQVGNNDPSFKHSNVLRELLMGQDGIIIDGSAVNTTKEIEGFDVDISNYNMDNLKIVAFIHKNGADYKDQGIVNGQIAKVGETKNFD